MKQCAHGVKLVIRMGMGKMKKLRLAGVMICLSCVCARGQPVTQAGTPAPRFEDCSDLALAAAASGSWASMGGASPDARGSSCNLWDGAVGDGFRKGAMELEATLGGGYGIRDGGGATHDIALSELRFGYVVSRVWGKGCWYQGNLEVLGELFVGAQFHPDARYFVGFTPILRYNFCTGTRWMPFIDGGAGVAATGISAPDLGEVFNFSLQAGPGIKYFFRDNAAMILQWRYFHLSDGGITERNKGVNVNTFLFGVSWGF